MTSSNRNQRGYASLGPAGDTSPIAAPAANPLYAPDMNPMHTTDIEFWSDTHKLRGKFFLPEDLDYTQEYPLIVICSGFTGVNSFHPARFARSLTNQGHVCFGFDYRGHVESEGPRGRVILEEQVRDLRHAVSYASAHRIVDRQKIILVGWGMAGGIVIEAYRGLPGVVGLAALNGFYNGQRLQLAHRGEQGLQAFINRINDERTKAAISGTTKMEDPFSFYPLDADSSQYVDAILRKEPGFEGENYSFELADSLLSWDPEAYVAGFQIPLFIAHGENNKLHPPEEAKSLYKRYGGPKTLYWMPDAGHTEWMLDENPIFQELCQQLGPWCNAVFNGETPQDKPGK